MANKFMIPEMVYMGNEALKMAIDEIVKLGKKALVVTGNSMIRQGHVSELQALLYEQGVDSVVFSGITGEPTDKMIEEGVECYQTEACDFLIGFGGGSPLDSAKAIGIIITNQGEIVDYSGGEIVNKIPSLVAIPSTAGTGSEATQFTVITDTKRNIKLLIKDPCLLPKLAVIDPKYTCMTPSDVTVATGLDALTHAIEAFTSRKAFSVTDVFALSSIKRIFEYLPMAYQDGTDLKAREELAIAAFEAGVCINNSSVTLVHGMSRPIGAIFHVPHGISNAMLLYECLSYVLDGAYCKFAQIARCIGYAKESDSDEVAAMQCMVAIRELCEICDVPTLAEYGINKDAFADQINKMAMDAYNSGSPANTKKNISKEDIKIIYRKLWEL